MVDKTQTPPPPRPEPTPCTITTKTLVAAPDGTPDTRAMVGVNERVEMSTSSTAAWTATCGTIVPSAGPTVIWTAPDSPGACTVTAALADGVTCSVGVTVLAPAGNVQVRRSDVWYLPGFAGSGFFGAGTVLPKSVSFSRVEVREERVTAAATGYYDVVLHQSGAIHEQGDWVTVTATNDIGTDRIGTHPPGTRKPFRKGSFSWAIPESYRALGSSKIITYSTAHHVQEMTGKTGEETTLKEGASRTRKP